MTDDALYDEAGDIPPVGGFKERRTQFRRATDEDAERARTIEHWTAYLFYHRGKLMMLISTVVAFLTWFFTSLGYRYTGPADDIKALDRKFTAKDSIMSVRVSRIEDSQAQIKDQLQSLAESMRFLTYMACQATDRDRRPATCYVVAKEIP